MPLPRLLGVALALPLGGALGNLLDRVRLGHVIDFLALYAGPNRQWQFPIFNLADSRHLHRRRPAGALLWPSAGACTRGGSAA